MAEGLGDRLPSGVLARNRRAGAVSDSKPEGPVRWVGANALAVADELASLRFDHAGPLYHRLLSSARFDSSFYTNDVSALLLARLALTEGFADWADAGSLGFLSTAHSRQDIACLALPLPTADDVEAERAEPGAVPTESLAGAIDLVIMNPPFTRNDIRNSKYDTAARHTLQEREIEVARFLKTRDPAAFDAIDQTSVRTSFSPLADMLLKKSEATLAVVTPTTALTSASGIPERKFLADRLQIECVITTHDPKRINFSDSTAIHESLLVARRPQAERGPTRFISLARMPRDAHEAILLSDLINRRERLGRWGAEHSWAWPRIRQGDWSAALLYSGQLAKAVRDLAALAESLLGPAGRFCRIEPGGQRIRDAFLPLAPRKGPAVAGRHSLRLPADAPPASGWTQRILWEHATDARTTMTAEADVLGVPKPERERYARTKLLGRASRPLVANRLYTHQVRVAACRSPVPLLGSAWTPVTPNTPSEDYENALCAWWNSTPGILTLLHARAPKLTYPRDALDSLRSLLVPDPDLADVTPLAEAFARCSEEPLLPWPRMHECPTRAILDQGAARVLRPDGSTVAAWRERIAREPTVSGVRPNARNGAG